MKKPSCGWLFHSFLKVSSQELGSLGLRFLIRFGVIPERQVEFFAELGGFWVCEGVDSAGILDDPIVDLRGVEILLERLVLLALYEGVVRAVQDENFRSDDSRCRRRSIETE